ncbi:MAG TPA: TetR/AcrR family transcriptional regulator [Vicinamibacteria bacterium]|nr:TetR/AcrR family transcriptional regulator [Vicinamibacteria bacterium]
MKPAPGPKRRVRAADATRQRLLRAAFEEIYRHGFQSASLDRILGRAGVTKGALYHHFQDKTALGYAVVEEVGTKALERWLGPLRSADTDSLTALQSAFRRIAATLDERDIELGCPLNNLAQEMSPIDPQFRRRIEGTFAAWRAGYARAIRRAQKEGIVRKDVNPRKVAAFLVAAAEGSFGTGKSAASRAMLGSNLEMLADWLETLRLTPRRSPKRTRKTTTSVDGSRKVH